MIRPLRKRERETVRAENPDPLYRVAVALDRENQPSADARERIVRMRGHEATRWETTL